MLTLVLVVYCLLLVVMVTFKHCLLLPDFTAYFIFIENMSQLSRSINTNSIMHKFNRPTILFSITYFEIIYFYPECYFYFN